ncbi:alpha/beta hydrolase [Parabacteroides pacaensis]|uniref:alpha/beta hydrolase n=1 Tax=Parabacteroides pacaensis TaxID=2086575 RepID=UPI000D0E888C|nr:alpha/beta hydrolase [Parabacteroides pacaensis]
MVHKYGKPSYSTVLVHGGPGAMGSLKPMAQRISSFCGVLEPLQSQYTIDGLIKELHDQIYSNTDQPVALIGHSWGAWLSLFFTVRYPELVKQLIVIGCAPFQEKYVPAITENRLHNLSPKEGKLFQDLLRQLSSHPTDASIKELERLIEKSDNHHIEVHSNLIKPDAKMFDYIWKEAVELRQHNFFERIFTQHSFPLFIIHGDKDPHPVKGVIEPLEIWGVPYRLYQLSHCGHSPFLEIEAKEEFYYLIQDIIKGNG